MIGNKSQTYYKTQTHSHILSQNKMGNLGACINVKKDSRSHIPKLQLTYIENTDNIQNCLSPQFFILDLAANQFDDTIQEIIRQNPTVKRFTSINSLRQFKDDHRNNVLIVCEDQHKYFKELLPNFTTFQKIAFTYANELAAFKETEKKMKVMYGYRLRKLIPFQKQSIQSILSSQGYQRSVYFFDCDAGLINRALATIYFFVDREIKPSFQIFQQYLSQQNEEGREIAAQLKKLLNQKSKLSEYFIKLLINENQVIHKAITLIKSTFNPGIIAHVSWFYQALQTYIRLSYIKLLPKIQLRQVFVVAELTNQEIKHISKGVNFMFSTFVIGFTSEEQAKKVKDHSANSYIFTIDLPKSLLQNQARQDFGFCLIENRVIFALQTVFRIDKFKKQQREILVTNGVLGKQLNARRQNFRYMEEVATADNLCMLKCFDYLAFCKYFIKSQNDLLLHLQYYHKYKSIARSDISSNISMPLQTESNINRISHQSSNKINASDTSTRSELLPSLVVDQKLADVEMALGNVQDAQTMYNNVAPIDRALLKKTYMYDRWNKQREFFQTIDKLKQIQITDVFANRFLQIALMSYNAVKLAHKQEFRQAQKKMGDSIKKLIDEFKAKFINRQNLQLHQLSVMSLPLYVILLKNQCRTRRKMKQISMAQVDEEAFSEGWAYFDGTHVSWLP